MPWLSRVNKRERQIGISSPRWGYDMLSAYLSMDFRFSRLGTTLVRHIYKVWCIQIWNILDFSEWTKTNKTNKYSDKTDFQRKCRFQWVYFFLSAAPPFGVRWTLDIEHFKGSWLICLSSIHLWKCRATHSEHGMTSQKANCVFFSCHISFFLRREFIDFD